MCENSKAFIKNRIVYSRQHRLHRFLVFFLAEKKKRREKTILKKLPTKTQIYLPR